MATVLIAGNTGLFTQEALERVAADNTVVLAGSDAAYDGKLRNIRVYETTPMEECFAQLFDVYAFEALWYVSGYVDGGEGAFGEVQMLERALNESANAKLEKFVLLSTIETQNYSVRYSASGGMAERSYPDSRVFSAAQMEALGRFFADKTGMKVITLWLPHVADRLNDKNFLGQVFRKMHRKEPVTFPHSRDDRVDILSASDLTDLLLQITDETDDDTASYFAVSGYLYTYGQLEDALRQAEPTVQVDYENRPDDIRWPDYPAQLRRRYGFVPLDFVPERIGEYYKYFVDEVYASEEGFLRRFLRRLGSGVFKYFELIVVFLLTELIAQYTSESVYFRFVDVRLAFIVIMGTVHGMRLGIVASILEGLVLVGQYMKIGMSGTLLFYNIENWIPFVIYLMAGSIPGYVRDKATEEISFGKKEYDLLRNKYVFLTNVYHGAIQNKGDFKRQILGFKDSFGKIFDAVQKLDSELPQSVFLEGLKVMEEIMENHTVAIYTVDAWQRFARLVACSGSLLSRLTVSMRLEEYARMFETVKGGGVWRNVELLPDMPMYACGVFQDGEVVMMVLLWEASPEQYGTHYTNIFQILCGLVQTSFLRAMEYEQLRHDQTTVPGTRAVTPERLDQILAVQEEMRQAGAAEYLLLRFEDRDPVHVSEALTGMVRGSDTLGQGSDGCMYLLLTQMTEKNFGIVGQRLADKGIGYQIVEKVGV